MPPTVEAAVRDESGWDAQLSAGLRAGLDFLAANPPLAHLLLVESLAAARPARLEHERTLSAWPGSAPPPGEPAGGGAISEETARLLAGGLASHLSGRVLAGEAERLPESHGLLFGYLLDLAAARRAPPPMTPRRRARAMALTAALRRRAGALRSRRSRRPAAGAGPGRLPAGRHGLPRSFVVRNQRLRIVAGDAADAAAARLSGDHDRPHHR